MSEAIGGYFELELSLSKPTLYPGALAYQSARAAFFALLRTGRPKRVWMPRYICDAMLVPLANVGVDCAFYNIDDSFNVADPVNLLPNDWLLYVNYFGICSENVDKTLERFDSARVVLDHSQALYSAPRDCLATIYSPRKFFGLPDGGLLVTGMRVEAPSEIDERSVSRVAHLVKRLAGSPESGYDDYRLAERSLDDLEPRIMSRLTQRILESVDYDRARVQRNQNFKFLHEKIGRFNQLGIASRNIDGPLCYPFKSSRPGLKDYLISKRVFIPTYWPEVRRRTSDGDIELELLSFCNSIPCDQRYNIEDMEKICQWIFEEEL